MSKKQVDRKQLVKFISTLEADLPKLDFDDSFQYHEPAYYNYINYYDELIEALLVLGADKHSSGVFGAYLVGLLAYQVIDLEKSLGDAVRVIIEELKTKLAEIDYEAELDNDDQSAADDDDTPKYDA